MKYLLILLTVLSLNVFAHGPDFSEITDHTNDAGEWKTLTFSPYRYKSPDGRLVYVCFKRFETDEATTPRAQCLDGEGKDAWTHARSIKIPGYTFSKFELKYSGEGYDKQGRTVVKVNLLVHFKKNIYI